MPPRTKKRQNNKQTKRLDMLQDVGIPLDISNIISEYDGKIPRIYTVCSMCERFQLQCAFSECPLSKYQKYYRYGTIRDLLPTRKLDSKSYQAKRRKVKQSGIETYTQGVVDEFLSRESIVRIDACIREIQEQIAAKKQQRMLEKNSRYSNPLVQSILHQIK